MNGPALCPSCLQPMPGTSCLAGHDRWEIESRPVVMGHDVQRAMWERNPWPCPDCGCPPGGMHHLGCDIEACPCGRGQAIACEHFGQRIRRAQLAPDDVVIDLDTWNALHDATEKMQIRERQYLEHAASSLRSIRDGKVDRAAAVVELLASIEHRLTIENHIAFSQLAQQFMEDSGAPQEPQEPQGD